MESAIKGMGVHYMEADFVTFTGVVDLNGRFFGGRTVSAGFFDHKRFANYDLAP